MHSYKFFTISISVYTYRDAVYRQQPLFHSQRNKLRNGGIAEYLPLRWKRPDLASVTSTIRELINHLGEAYQMDPKGANMNQTDA